jgi:flavodoxin
MKIISMKTMVTYWSQTGNTKKVAEAIFRAIPFEKTIKPFDAVDSLDGFDLIFIGFPVMQFGSPPPARKFIKAYADGKNIALFVTHAMLSDGSDPVQQALLGKEIGKCAETCSSASLLGLFHCQGELSEKMAGELMASGIPMLMEFAAMRPATLGHPSAGELKLAENFGAHIAKSFHAFINQTKPG